MTLEILFLAGNFTAVAAWILLGFAPDWKWTQRIVLSGAVSLVFAGIYIGVVIASIGTDGGNFTSLEGVMTIFKNPIAVVAGWYHYLAFDLFIGTWQVKDAKKHKVNRWILLPCLFLTLWYGPVGLLSYFIVRAVVTKQFFHQ